jgi:hypothetical protein
MYREAIALFLHSHRPDAEVLLAPPEATDDQVRSFRPDVIMRNDNDGAPADALARVMSKIEVLYSDSMDSQVSLDGESSKVKDMSMDDLLRVLDELEDMISGETAK